MAPCEQVVFSRRSSKSTGSLVPTIYDNDLEYGHSIKLFGMKELQTSRPHVNLIRSSLEFTSTTSMYSNLP